MAWVSVQVPPTCDLPRIAALAGQSDSAKRYYEDCYLYVDEVTQEDLEAAVATVGDSVPVPASVTPLQARKALRAADLYGTAQIAIAAAPAEVQDAWEYAIEIRRDDPAIQTIATAVGLTDTQVDDLFRSAASL